MKSSYKGFDLEVKRARIDGDMVSVGSALRQTDGLDLVGETVGDFSVQDMIEELKSYVDDYEKNPKQYEE